MYHNTEYAAQLLLCVSDIKQHLTKICNNKMYTKNLEFSQRSETQKTNTGIKDLKDGTLDTSWNVGKIIFLRHK